MFFKLALDNQISNRCIRELSKHYEIVYTAKNEPDEIWLEDAYGCGANIVISPDLDIPNYLDRMRYDDVIWIEVPQNLRSAKQYDFIIKKLEKLKKRI